MALPKTQEVPFKLILKHIMYCIESVARERNKYSEVFLSELASLQIHSYHSSSTYFISELAQVYNAWKGIFIFTLLCISFYVTKVLGMKVVEYPKPAAASSTCSCIRLQNS